MKRVLFVTYYYPPSGGPGVQRILNVSKYLGEFGWQPTVLTLRPDKASYPNLDEKLLERVPANVEVIRTSSWDPYTLYGRLTGKSKSEVVSVGFLGASEPTIGRRIANWVRANLFIPDARVGWLPFAVARGRALLREKKFDAVLTTGPPHSTHLVGLMLARSDEIPWLADFRDPWTKIEYYSHLPMTSLAKSLDSALEKSVIKNAAAVNVVTSGMKDQFMTLYPRKYEIIPNGFNEDDFAHIRNIEPDRDHFTISYIGNLNMRQNPTALWDALSREFTKKHSRIRLRLVGNVDPGVLDSAEERGLLPLIEVVPFVPHEDALRYMMKSNMLLLSINKSEGAESIVTGKLFEYIASGRPVLGIGPAGGDAARIVCESRCGSFFDYSDADGVRAYLSEAYQRWLDGENPAGSPEEIIPQYSFRNRTRMIAAVLDRITESS